MEDIYGLQATGEYSDKGLLMTPENLILPSEYQSLLASAGFRDRIPMFGSEELLSVASAISEAALINHEYQREQDIPTVIKAKIASHPSYPKLLQAYVDCQKVGAPPEVASLLDEIRRENDLSKQGCISTCLGADPELDEFMETYCDMLVKYKSDLSRPFDEATTFLNMIESQLSNLCTGASLRSHSVGKYEGRYGVVKVECMVGLHNFYSVTEPMYERESLVQITWTPAVSALRQLLHEGAVSSGEDLSGGEAEELDSEPRGEERNIKDRLLRRFGSRIGTLKLEFSKKKKKGKLPKEARQTLLSWWNVHYKWPYPTEADKIALAETTGLDQKQINNWFINQRKRHWKPSENMQFAVMDNLPGRIYTDD